MTIVNIRTLSHGNITILKFHDRLIVYLIFLYWLMYENIIFFNAGEGGVGFQSITNLLKLLIPIVLLALTGINARLAKAGNSQFYLVFFSLFLIYIGIVTAIFGDLAEWLKLLPRCLFFYIVLSFFHKSPASFYLYAKLVISYVLFSFVQYIFTYFTGAYNNPVEFFGYSSSGLSGLFANITSIMYFPASSVPIVRLAGFWNEPSNASGSAFASFFLAKLLFAHGYSKLWNYASYACLIAGFLCFSNVGYLSFGIACFVSIANFYRSNLKLRDIFFIATIFIVALFFVLLVFLGRSFLAASNNQNYIMRAIVGLRDTAPNADVYGGRFDLLSNTLSYLSANPFGKGLVEISSTTNDLLSASAFVYWLLIGGLTAVLLIIFREFALIHASLSLIKTSRASIFLVQALVVVMIQHLSYGTWMNPNYFILAGAVLAFSTKKTNRYRLPPPLS